MQQILQNVQNRIKDKVASLKYIDEDWGQLDYYTQNPPVQWPCCLFDISGITWTNQGKFQQSGSGEMVFHIANLKLTNTSAKAPANQRNAAWSIHNVIQELHQAIHGFVPAPGGTLYRKRTQRVKRDDGVQQFAITYLFTCNGIYDTGGDVAKKDTPLGIDVERNNS